MTFTQMPLDRVATLRADPAWVARRLQDPASRTIAANATGVLLDGASRPSLLRGPAPSNLCAAFGSQAPILLGLTEAAALFALDLESLEPRTVAQLGAGGRIVTLREAASVLSAHEAGLAAYAAALLNWHRRHGFCANCGEATSVLDGGYSRRCDACGLLHFPRTDPVVIVLVEHDGHLLLGRRADWPAGQYSVLAGFVAPGESLEEAVIREVK